MTGKLAYKWLIENGICTNCATRPAIDGKKSCAYCVEYRKKYYKKHVSTGKCWHCKKEPVQAPRTTCKKCNEERSAYFAIYNQLKKEAK